MMLAGCLLLLSLTADGDPQGAGPYCGLHCVHAVAYALGKSCELETLLDKRYLSGPYGSSADDLCRALRTLEVDSRLAANITYGELRAANFPVILHTRSPGSDTGYRHWMLFLGFDGDNVRLYDPPRSTAMVPFEELQSIWDGVGIMTGPLGRVSMGVVPVEWLILTGTAAVLSFSFKRLRGSIFLLMVAAGVGLARHAVLPGGFIVARTAIENVVARHFPATPQEIGYAELETSRASAKAIVVDARFPRAYRDGHIPGAVNVPVAIGFCSLRDALSTIPKDRHVIVYCQSERCHWSDDVANHFLPRGYQRVSVYRGGMNAWRAEKAAAEREFGG